MKLKRYRCLGLHSESLMHASEGVALITKEAPANIFLALFCVAEVGLLNRSATELLSTRVSRNQ